MLSVWESNLLISGIAEVLFNRFNIQYLKYQDVVQ